jgi:hypothetical protein
MYSSSDFNLNTRWKRVIKLTSRPKRRKNPVSIGAYRNLSGGFGEHKNLVTLPEFFLSLCTISVLLVPIVLAIAFCPYCTTHTTQTSMPPEGFEPAIPTSDRPQTLALDRSATGFGRIRTPHLPRRTRVAVTTLQASIGAQMASFKSSYTTVSFNKVL